MDQDAGDTSPLEDRRISIKLPLWLTNKSFGK
jgi:hypothetical protein